MPEPVRGAGSVHQLLAQQPHLLRVGAAGRLKAAPHEARRELRQGQPAIHRADGRFSHTACHNVEAELQQVCVGECVGLGEIFLNLETNVVDPHVAQLPRRRGLPDDQGVREVVKSFSSLIASARLPPFRARANSCLPSVVRCFHALSSSAFRFCLASVSACLSASRSPWSQRRSAAPRPPRATTAENSTEPGRSRGQSPRRGRSRSWYTPIGAVPDATSATPRRPLPFCPAAGRPEI